MKTVRGVIFDLDGTLLNTIDDIRDAINSVMCRFGFREHDTAACKQMVGEGVEQLVCRAVPPEARMPDVLQRCNEAMREAYVKNWDHKTHVYTGVAEMLDGLRSKGIKTGILSNKTEEFVEKAVDKFLPESGLHPVWGAIPERPKKPSPEGALSIAQTWEIPASSVLFVGDSDIDIKTALAARMIPIGVAWGFRDVRELTMSAAIAILNEPGDLLKMLDKQRLSEKTKGSPERNLSL